MPQSSQLLGKSSPPPLGIRLILITKFVIESQGRFHEGVWLQKMTCDYHMGREKELETQKKSYQARTSPIPPHTSVISSSSCEYYVFECLNEGIE